MEKQIPLYFDVSFGGLRPTDDSQLYLSSVRVFYKYSNRNGSYITDDFAETFSKTAYCKPIIGCYDVEKQDFLGHEGAEEAKAYGFVIPNSLTWQEHLDEDGVLRTYATYDVLLWAQYWDEAKKIFSKSQSMEIDPKTVRGEWRLIEGSPFEEFVYTDGEMAGLCVLGDTKTPCFEGAAFFTTDDNSYVEFTKAVKNYFSNGGKNAMNVKVAGLDHEHFEAFWDYLNPNFNEESAYLIECLPCEIAENYFCAVSCDGKISKYTYSFTEEGALVVDEQVEVIDYKENAATFESQNAEISNQLTEANSLYEELKNQYEALVSDKEALAARFEELQNQFDSLKATYESAQQEIEQKTSTISEYENREKEAIINKFSACLPTEIVSGIADKKNELTIAELNTAFAIEYTKFSMAKEQKEDIHIPQEPKEEPALYKILKAYRK